MDRTNADIGKLIGGLLKIKDENQLRWALTYCILALRDPECSLERTLAIAINRAEIQVACEAAMDPGCNRGGISILDGSPIPPKEGT